MGNTGDLSVVTAAVNGGAGADSIIFSGNNVVSGSIGEFVGNDAAGSGGFVYASGDSTLTTLDTISVSNEAVTGGQAMQQGTFGSAGFLFEDFNARDFTFAIDAAQNSAGDSQSRSLTNAIFIASGGAAVGTVLAGAGGVVIGGSAGTQTAGLNGAFVLSGGSTIDEVVSAVDALAVGRGTTNVFNVQNGSAGYRPRSVMGGPRPFSYGYHGQRGYPPRHPGAFPPRGRAPYLVLLS